MWNVFQDKISFFIWYIVMFVASVFACKGGVSLNKFVEKCGM